VARVSSHFKEIISDPATWRIRVAKRFPGQYPALPPSPWAPLDWSFACCRREAESSHWISSSSLTPAVECGNAHYSCVDAVQILDDVVVSGSRDRGINVWSLHDGLESGAPSLKNPGAHKGWVWSLSRVPREPNMLVSGSWDNSVKFWQVTPTSLVEIRKAVNLRVAVLCTSVHGDQVVAGTYDKKVIMMDRREGNKKTTYYRSHAMPVLAVKATERLILSLSEDRNLCVYDRRAGKRLSRLPIPGHSFPLCLSLSDHCLYVGDKGGNLHLLDPSHDRFDIVHEYSGLHKGKINSVVHGLGSVITGASDGDIKVWQPSRALEPMARLGNPECGEVGRLDYCVDRQILAAAFSNNTVKIWRREQ